MSATHTRKHDAVTYLHPLWSRDADNGQAGQGETLMLLSTVRLDWTVGDSAVILSTISEDLSV